MHQSVLNKALNESESVFDGTRVVDLSDSIGSIKIWKKDPFTFASNRKTRPIRRCAIY
ncbi:hypothetical protein [Allobaculum sp. Allo2]|uniref:hypothetical protein n=1 Tax=Allobaculum sp. Allo2 TaxID=2853432 RepID=UPI001F621873|nr:hypothetical protein [Allobaculum sp. Allo2]UNT92526.1 hypothetical protein KWG61_10225 [Allobaculum sp. Allo2]